MDLAALSDTFFTLFILSLIASALLFTNGAMLPSGGMFNAGARFSKREASSYNDLSSHMATRARDKDIDRPRGEKDSILSFALVCTGVFFVLFLLVEFVFK